MRAMCFAMWALVSTAVAAPPVQNAAVVELGPKAYRDGDVIEITQVTATSPRLEQGDSVTVRGRVRLESRSSAMLCLFLTQTRSDRSGEVNPEQTKEVQSGELVPFELKTTIKQQGALHVTLYDVKSGKPFGGTYFGTPEQMSQIKNWNVQHYLPK